MLESVTVIMVGLYLSLDDFATLGHRFQKTNVSFFILGDLGQGDQRT